jgi:hypothetical protein
MPTNQVALIYRDAEFGGFEDLLSGLGSGEHIFSKLAEINLFHMASFPSAHCLLMGLGSRPP